MIREFAFGFANRHYFQESNNAVKWECVAKDTFVSLLDWKNSEDNYNTSQFFNNDIYYNLCNICIKKLENQLIKL